MTNKVGIVRSLSLDEWFLSLQLEKIKDGFHLPWSAKIDITHLVQKYQKEGTHLSLTALLIKVSSILIKENPECNRIFFKTIFGKKIVEAAYNAVNVPVEIRTGDKRIISSAVIRDAYTKNLEEISAELKAQKSKSLHDLPINNLIHGPGFKFLNKLKLRIIFFLFSNFPSFYLKKMAGGISVSTLFSANKANHNISISAFGMTTYTICSANSIVENDKTFLNVNIGFDHGVTHGIDGTRAIEAFVKIFSRDDL